MNGEHTEKHSKHRTSQGVRAAAIGSPAFEFQAVPPNELTESISLVALAIEKLTINPADEQVA